MKTSIKKSAAIMVMAAGTLLSAFIMPGGDSYSLYINDERVVEQYVTRQATVPEVRLPGPGGSSNLKAYYNHCGRIGTDRKLTLSAAGKTLREWRFKNVTEEREALMSIPLTEVFSVSSGQTLKVSLTYTANELPDGKVLATLLLDKTSASVK